MKGASVLEGLKMHHATLCRGIFGNLLISGLYVVTFSAILRVDYMTSSVLMVEETGVHRRKHC